MVKFNDVIKRNGILERFDIVKIVNAIRKAAAATGTEIDYDLIKKEIAEPLEKMIQKQQLGVEEIQDQVEIGLMKHYPDVAKAYILYRESHKREREQKGEK
jgi:anaerobic ribonucleoside-triphosphate reductase